MPGFEKRPVVFAVQSVLCTKETPLGDNYYDREDISLTAFAKSFGNERDQESVDIPLNLPLFAVTTARADYSNDNVVRACFFVNNLDQEKKDEYEIEVEMSDQKEDLFIDYLTPVKVNEDKILIRAADYSLNYVPSKKPYYLRAELYANGTIFTKAYKIGEDNTVVDLTDIAFRVTGFRAWLATVRDWFSNL
jgi:hypothetical protein